MDLKQTIEPGQRLILDSGGEVVVRACDEWGIVDTDLRYHLRGSLVCLAAESREQYETPEKKPIDKHKLWLAAIAYVRAAAAKERADEAFRVCDKELAGMLTESIEIVLRIRHEHFLFQSSGDGDFVLRKVEVY